MDKPQIGQVYYKVSFIDSSLKIPQVHPMIFVGTDLYPDLEDVGVTSYYFLPAAKYPDDEADDEEPPLEYYSCNESGLNSYHTLIEAVAVLAVVAADVDLTKPPGERGLNL